MTIKIADKFKNDAIATLVQICRDEGAPAAARAQSARDLLSWSIGRPAQAKPLTVADLSTLTPMERGELFAALVKFYPQDIQIEGIIQQIVDQVIQEASTPKLEFRRGKPALPSPSPAHIQESPPSGREEHESGASPYSDNHQPSATTSAPARRGYDDGAHLSVSAARPVDVVDACSVGSYRTSPSNDRSERLAALAAPYLPRDKRAPLAADSSDGMAHALRLSRLSAAELEARYFGRFTSSDTDPTIWRGRK